jgi:hypothetical protein
VLPIAMTSRSGAHVAAADRVRFLPKQAWAAVIICISPFGGAAYLLSQRPRRFT